MVDVDFSLEQFFHHIDVSSLTCGNQRCATETVIDPQIWIGLQRELENVEISAGTGQEERTIEFIVLRVDIGPGLYQESGAFDMVVTGRCEQRRASFSIVKAAFWGFPIVLTYDTLFLLPMNKRRARRPVGEDPALQKVARAGRSRPLVNLVRALFAIDSLFAWLPFGPGLLMVGRKARRGD